MTPPRIPADLWPFDQEVEQGKKLIDEILTLQAARGIRPTTLVYSAIAVAGGALGQLPEWARAPVRDVAIKIFDAAAGLADDTANDTQTPKHDA